MMCLLRAPDEQPPPSALAAQAAPHAGDASRRLARRLARTMAKPHADHSAIEGLEALLAGVLRRSRLSIVVLAGDGAVVWANDAAMQTLPALDPARAGANLVDVVDVAAAGAGVDPRDRCAGARKTLSALELPVRNGRWLRVELQALSKDVVANPRLAAALSLQDVTPRRRARERERAEGELMRQTGQLGRVGAWEYDVDAGKVNWSDETFEIHGLKPVAEPDLRTFVRLYDAASRERWLAALPGRRR